LNTNIKYRPASLTEFVYPNNAVKSTIEMYASGATMRPLILHGTYGTGKSLLAELLPKAIDGNDVWVDRYTADDVRNKASIEENLTRDIIFDSLMEPVGQTRYYTVFDECIFDKKILLDALRLALDKMEGRSLFIFTTNELDKFDPGVISRSTALLVPPLTPATFLDRANQILQSEGITLPDDALLDVLEKTYMLSKDNRRLYEVLDTLIWKAFKR